MKKRKSILVVSDLRAAAPSTVQPFAGVDRYVRERRLEWDLIVEPRPPRAVAGEQTSIDGVIGRITAEAAAFATSARVPIVSTWASSPVRTTPFVIPDFEGAGRLAADFFLSRGLRRLTFIGTNMAFSTLLAKGFRTQAEELGGRCNAISVEWWFDRSDATFTRFMARIRDMVTSLRPPVGILAFDDFACRYAVRACAERGLSVPGDIAVLGLTNNYMACAHPPPSLSSIDLNLEVVGYRAAGLLDALMKRQKPPDGPILVPPLGIVPRQSTDNSFADDELVAEALRFISSHYATQIRTADIARHVAASERTLQRRFAEIMGHSIVHEVVLQRVRRAKQSLVDTNRLVKQIALQCGFSDVQHFCRTFQRLEGVSPTTYREHFKA